MKLPRNSSNLLFRAGAVLDSSDRKKALLICLAYVVMGFLDVLGVLTLGIVGSLAVSGISSNKPGNRVSSILSVLNIDSSPLQVQVGILGAAAAFVLIVKTIVSLYLTKRILFFLGRRSAVISRNLIEQLLEKDLLSIRNRTIQETIFAITEGVRTIVVAVFGSALLLISDIILLFILGITLFAIDITVAVSSLVVFSSLGIILYRFMHTKARKLGEEATQLSIASNDKISEIVNCYRELLVKDRRNYYAEKIGGMRLQIGEAGARLSIMTVLSKYIMEMAMVLGGLFIGAIQFLTQPATRAVAVISIFLVASARIVPGVLRIQTGFISIKTAASTALPTLELVESEFQAKSIRTNQAAIPFQETYSHDGFLGNVKISKLTFNYPGKIIPALKDINLEISSGEFVGIVGPSGSGKSTLVDFLLGVIGSAHSGEVAISGLPSNLAIKRWPGAIGYVPQESNFINSSIKDNICLGFNSSEVPDSQVIQVLKMVELSEFTSSPESIQSTIGENGRKLSGGQRQRLGIARALLTHPKLLIMDEATSSLDAITEARLTDYFEKLKGKLTLVVIAHRLSTVKNADRLIYLKEGKILGTGSFADLRINLPEFDAQANSMGISQ